MKLATERPVPRYDEKGDATSNGLVADKTDDSIPMAVAVVVAPATAAAAPILAVLRPALRFQDGAANTAA